MSDDVDPDLRRALMLMPSSGSIGNLRLRRLLGLDEATYSKVAEGLKRAGFADPGRGRGGSLTITARGRRLQRELTKQEPGRDDPDAKGLASPASASSPTSHSAKTTGTTSSLSPATSPYTAGPRVHDQGELERRLWDAANSLRGPVDPADFKAYIFPLLFFKRISDAWDEEHRRALEDFNGELKPAVEADYHRFELPTGCHWADLRKVSENVGVAIQHIFQRIERANPDTLAGIFGDVAWANKDRLPEPNLLNLVAAFDSLDLTPSKVGSDVLGAAYEYLLKQFADASGQKAGEFFTPRPVVRLLCRILEPRATDSIYDPACGSGGMLVEAANEVIEAGGFLSQMRFYGQEASLTTAAIARMNLYLHDIEDAEVKRGDTLRDPKFLDDRGRLRRFDVVIANPPFSLKKWGHEVWASDPWGRAACGVPPAGFGDYAWVQHMVASMKPGTGRLGVVVPHGVLFRGGAEAQIRQCLVQSDQLEAVIGLPPNLFYNTTIPACLLIFRAKKPPERQGHVLIVDGSARFEKGKNKNQLRDSDIEAILAAYRDPATAGSDVPARLVSHAEIKENGWVLNIGRYFKTSTMTAVDVPAALEELRRREAVLDTARAGMWERLAAAGYGEVIAAGYRNG